MTSHLVTRLRWAVLVACLGIITPPVSAETGKGLVPFEASYTAAMEKGVSLNGSAKRTLTPQGNNTWLYRTDVSSFIVNIDESVLFRWEHGWVVPLNYRYHLSGFLIKDRKQSIDFDWSKGVATGEYKGDSFQVAIEDGVLDPLGFQLQLHQDISNGKRKMAYRVLDGRSVETDRVAVIDNKAVIRDGNKTIATLKAEKVRKDSSRQTLMWFAPDQNYLLVRLLQVEPDGSRYELKLKDADFRP